MILVIESVISSQQVQVVCQLPRSSEVVHVYERMRWRYGLVVSSPCAHDDRNYFAETGINTLE